MPERIQLHRTKGWRKPEGVITVSRPTKWGNPFAYRERMGGLVHYRPRAQLVDARGYHRLPGGISLWSKLTSEHVRRVDGCREDRTSHGPTYAGSVRSSQSGVRTRRTPDGSDRASSDRSVPRGFCSSYEVTAERRISDRNIDRPSSRWFARTDRGLHSTKPRTVKSVENAINVRAIKAEAALRMACDDGWADGESAMRSYLAKVSGDDN